MVSCADAPRSRAPLAQPPALGWKTGRRCTLSATADKVGGGVILRVRVTGCGSGDVTRTSQSPATVSSEAGLAWERVRREARRAGR